MRGIREARKQEEIAKREQAARKAEWLARLNAGQVALPPGHPAARQPPYPNARSYPHPYPHAREEPRYQPYAPSFTSTPAWSSMRDDPTPRVGAESAIRGQSTPPVPARATSAPRSDSQPPQPTRPSPTADNTSSAPEVEASPASPPTALSDAAASNAVVSDNAEPQANGSGTAVAGGPERAQDKNPESDSVSARQIPPANGGAPTVSLTDSPPSPRQALARRLLDAALAREPKPELHVDLTSKPSAPPEYYRHGSHHDSQYSDIGALPDLMDEMHGEMGYGDVDMLG